jgi:ankyrin repeat protein
VDDIFAAIQAGDVAAVERLVAADPAAAAARNPEGVSAVLFARYQSKLDVLDLLLRAGQPLDIFEAAAVGRTERVEELLVREPGLAAAYSADGFTPLHYACFFGHPATARLLLDRGAAVNALARNEMRVTPLHSALAARQHDLCEMLIAAGSSVNAAQQEGWTPLHEAALLGDRRLVELLLAGGADPTKRKEDGETPAAVAVSHGHAEIAELLRGQA